MSKNLKVIQTTSRVLEIISKIAMILCIVGAVSCLVGVVLLSLSYLKPDFVETTEQQIMQSIINRAEPDSMDNAFFRAYLSDNYKPGDLVFITIGACLAGLTACIVGTVVTKLHKDYFAMEQKVGTPFTYEGAKAFRTLGIVNIVAPFITWLIAFIIGQIFHCGEALKTDFSIGLGVAMILLSFVFAYGAEREEDREQQDEGHCCHRHEEDHHCCCREREAAEEAQSAETPTDEEN